MIGPFVFKVTEAVGPLVPVPVVKQSIDVREVIVDFARWLGPDESLSQVWGFAIQANPSISYPSWQTDFPFVTPSSPAPSDTIPLILVGATIISTTQARIQIGNGTPGLTYMFSFLATAAPSQRMKEIDLLVSVNPSVNSQMVSSISVPALSVTAVSGTVALAVGTSGSVNVANTSGAAITITLPPTPVLDQILNFKDVAGNAQTFGITIQGAAGALIDGGTVFSIDQNYGAISFKWTGAQWSVL